MKNNKKQRKSEETRMVLNIFENDHKNNLQLCQTLFNNNNTNTNINSSTSSFSSSSQENLQIQISNEEFLTEISKAIILITHTLWKEDSILIPLIEKYITNEYQSKIVREIFDISPPQYFSRMIPWTFRNLNDDEQNIFIDSLKMSLAKPQFDAIYNGIRKLSRNDLLKDSH